jgi:heptosyltransferase-2
LAAFCVDAGYQVWLFGSDKERDLGAAVKQHSKSVHLTDIQDLCGATNLAQAIDLLSISTGVVCNDSGLMHIAAALSVPVLALYGSSSPKFTPPLSPKAEILSLNLACSPCFKRVCPLQHLNCLNNLLPDTVWRTLQKAL